LEAPCGPRPESLRSPHSGRVAPPTAQIDPRPVSPAPPATTRRRRPTASDRLTATSATTRDRHSSMAIHRHFWRLLTAVAVAAFRSACDKRAFSNVVLRRTCSRRPQKHRSISHKHLLRPGRAGVKGGRSRAAGDRPFQPSGDALARRSQPRRKQNRAEQAADHARLSSPCDRDEHLPGRTVLDGAVCGRRVFEGEAVKR
jgi:hypothetical protein